MASSKEFLPHFIILGAQKSASTFLSDVLRHHPNVYMPRSEITFFQNPEYNSQDLAPLRAIFCDRHERNFGIKRPDYLAKPEVAPRLRKHVPAAKLVAVLREPLSRLISAYYYYVKIGLIPPQEINAFLPRLLRGDKTLPARANELLSYGLYAQHLERYLAHFPSKQVYVLLHEDLNQSPARTLNNVYDFLSLERVKQIPGNLRDNRGVYSLPRLHFLTQRNRFLYSYGHESKLVEKNGVLNLMSAGFITMVDRYILSTIFGNSKPKLKPSLLGQLRDYYRSDIVHLESLLQRDLSKWKT